jgi:xylulokinase
VFKSFEEASSRAIRIKEIIQPVDEWVNAYDKLYPYYVKMYQDLDQDLMDLKQTLAK